LTNNVIVMGYHCSEFVCVRHRSIRPKKINEIAITLAVCQLLLQLQLCVQTANYNFIKATLAHI